MSNSTMQDDDHDIERHDGFELAALCVSPLMSPALTTAASDDSEGFRLGSEGLATEEREDAINDERQDGHGEDQEESRSNDLVGVDNRGERAVIRRDEKDGEDENHLVKCNSDDGEHSENEVANAPSVDDHVSLDEPKTAAETGTKCVHDDLNAITRPVSAFALSTAYNDDTDDDLTVECASPRDPADLDEVKSPPLENKLVSRVVPPLPTAQVTATTEPSPVVYSLTTLFPVVYEELDSPRASTETTISQKEIQKPRQKSRRQTRPTKVIQHDETTANQAQNEKVLVTLPPEMDRTGNDRTPNTTKALALQLQVAENDRKQLAQRNARLKSQLAQLTSDLVRTKAEAAKWKTENELYAAKMPKLQAELSEETTQVDEKHAQTIQSQLEITQLRAKVQVLQTRAGNLDAQVEKLQHEVRVAKKDVRRRAILQQQMEEKMKRLENEFQDVRVTHSQELLLSKQKLNTTVQRLEHERVKRETELKKSHHQELEEMRMILTKMVKKCKELEQAHATREHDCATMKKRLEEAEEEFRMHSRHVKASETLLARSERVEMSLRTQVSTLKAQLKLVEHENSKILRSSSVARPLRSRRSTQKAPSSIRPSPRRAVSTSTEAAPVLCSCCQMVVDSMVKADRRDDPEEPVLDLVSPPKPMESACERCQILETDIATAQNELTQLRALHVRELQVQATAFERIVAAFRPAAPQCA